MSFNIMALHWVAKPVVDYRIRSVIRQALFKHVSRWSDNRVNLDSLQDLIPPVVLPCPSDLLSPSD